MKTARKVQGRVSSRLLSLSDHLLRGLAGILHLHVLQLHLLGRPTVELYLPDIELHPLLLHWWGNGHRSLTKDLLDPMLPLPASPRLWLGGRRMRARTRGHGSSRGHMFLGARALHRSRHQACRDFEGWTSSRALYNHLFEWYGRKQYWYGFVFFMRKQSTVSVYDLDSVTLKAYKVKDCGRYLGWGLTTAYDMPNNFSHGQRR